MHICLICNAEIKNLKGHVFFEHNIELKEYVIQYLYNGDIPKCKCGCNEEMAFTIKVDNYFREYKVGHHVHRKLL